MGSLVFYIYIYIFFSILEIAFQTEYIFKKFSFIQPNQILIFFMIHKVRLAYIFIFYFLF